MYEMRLYILNTTKPYRDNENDYAGAWFVCPVEFEEIKEKLGIEKEEDFEIEDYELPFTLNPDMPLWEINALCRMIQEIEGTPIKIKYNTMRYQTVRLWQNTSLWRNTVSGSCHQN